MGSLPVVRADVCDARGDAHPSHGLILYELLVLAMAFGRPENGLTPIVFLKEAYFPEDALKFREVLPVPVNLCYVGGPFLREN